MLTNLESRSNLFLQVNVKSGLSPGVFTNKIAMLRDMQHRKRKAIATTHKAKKKRVELRSEKYDFYTCALLLYNEDLIQLYVCSKQNGTFYFIDLFDLFYVCGYHVHLHFLALQVLKRSRTFSDC